MELIESNCRTFTNILHAYVKFSLVFPNLQFVLKMFIRNNDIGVYNNHGNVDVLRYVLLRYDIVKRSIIQEKYFKD